ncbi:hypothetical protein ACOCJ5_17690, partial [Knoellia sp. CPCC 206450]|uniref:hypothetical protein n=1 Tax=Knoellia tibetensis TaxID=3404798 RepID=UPI003B427E81
LRNGSTSTIHLLGDIAGYYLEGAPGPTWTVRGAPLPANAEPDSGSLDDVDCPSLTMCHAVGTFADASGAVHVWVSSRSSGAWTSKDLGSAGESIYEGDISCASSTFCAVSFSTWDEALERSEGYNLALSGGAWKVLNRTESPQYALECPGEGTCHALTWAADQSPRFATYSGGSWASAPLPLPSDATGEPGYYGHLSCWAVTGCAALGGYTAPDGRDAGIISRISGSSKTVIPVPTPAGAVYGQYLDDLSCTAATLCAFGGYYVNSAGNQALSVGTVSGDTVVLKPAPLPSDAVPAPDSELSEYVISAVSCGGQACAAVGSYRASTGLRPLALSLVDGSWTARSVASPGGFGYFEDVSCPDECIAVGVSGSSGLASTVPLTGAVSSVVLARLFNVSPISCPSTALCVALGWQEMEDGSTTSAILERS